MLAPVSGPKFILQQQMGRSANGTTQGYHAEFRSLPGEGTLVYIKQMVSRSCVVDLTV